MRRQIDNKTLITVGIMTVVITLLTCLLRIELSFLRNGQDAGVFISLGDVGLYIAYMLLGAPWAAVCGAVGTALGEIIVGSAVYAPLSLVLRPLMVVTAHIFLKNDTSWSGVIKGVGFASAVMVLGSFIYNLVILTSYSVAALSLPLHLLQSLACSLIAAPILKLVGRKSGSDSSFPEVPPTRRNLK